MDTRALKSPLLPAAAAAGYVLLATCFHGPGITSDSIHYFTVARHLREAGTITTYTGEPLVSYAPLLSVTYALLGLTGIDLQLAARLVSASSFAAVVWIAWRWLEEMPVSTLALWVGAVLVLLARPLLWHAPYALSELPFMALTMYALWQAWRYAKSGGRAHLVASGIGAALSAVMRWIGITTIVTVGVFLLLDGYGTWRRRLVVASGYVLTALVPFVLWVLRNRLLTGTFFGIREPSDYPIREMVFDTLWSLHRWVVPVAFENSVPLFALLVVGGFVSLALTLRHTWRNGEAPVRKGIKVLAIFCILYSAALFTTARGAKFEALSERLWSPVAVPLALGAVLVWNLLLSPGRFAQVARGVWTVAVIGWCVSGSVFGAEMLSKCFRDGPGVFNTSAWRHSQVIRWLRRHSLAGKVYSNFPEPLYYFTGVISEHTPHKGPMRVASETHPRNLQQFLQRLQDDRSAGRKTYIVWFNDPSRSEYLYRLEELQRYLSLHVVAKLRDGQVMEVQPRRMSENERGNR